MVGHTDDCILADREDDRHHREAHGDAHHQGVALVVTKSQVLSNPLRRIATEEGNFYSRTNHHCQDAGQADYRDQQQRLITIGDAVADSVWHT
jgi:hypothetical protein